MDAGLKPCTAKYGKGRNERNDIRDALITHSNWKQNSTEPDRQPTHGMQ
jgi:hypothetical protein